MKRVILAVLVVFITLMNCVAFAKDYTQTFWDVPKDHWAFESIADLTEWDIINGYDDNSFNPEKTVSRAEWAKMLLSVSGRNTNNTNVHLALENSGDLSKYHWASIYMVAVDDIFPCYMIDDVTYYFPEREATREEVASSLVKLMGYDINGVDTSVLNEFEDAATISDEQKENIAAAVRNGIINGYEDNTIRAQNALTRAEAATIINNCFGVSEDETFDWESCIGRWCEWYDGDQNPFSSVRIHKIDNGTVTYSLDFYRRAALDYQTAQVNGDGTFDFYAEEYDQHMSGKISFKYNRAILNITESDVQYIQPQIIKFNVKEN